MANSDNVLRGGLTPKKVDLIQLTKTLEFSSCGLRKVEPKQTNNEATYKTSAQEFQLSKIVINTEQNYTNNKVSSAEVLLCTGGEGVIHWADNTISLNSGESVFIPQAITEYTVSGVLELFRAVVPI